MNESRLDAVVRDNLARVHERIAAAARRAGRPPSDVRLVGVTKYVGPAETAALVRAGCRTLGEARPQQLAAKVTAAELAGLDIEWRLIGHLQRNKAPGVVALGATIDGIDSRRLLDTLDRAAAERGVTQPALLEVNTSGDATKHGFTPDELAGVVADLDEWPHLRVEGLMTIAALEGGPEVARRNFAALRSLRDKVATPERPLAELSMGMSSDLEEAILEGATLVRVGSALWTGLLPSTDKA